MPPPDEAKIQLEKFANEFYTQALNLTLSNPLLRLPTGARSTRFLEVPYAMMQMVADALSCAGRSVTFIGQDASPTEVRLAAQSQLPTSSATLRIALPLPHDRVEALLRKIAKQHDELLEKRGLPCAYLALGFLKWTPDDEKETRSPLLLVSVDIEQEFDSNLRKTIYKLSPTDRDATENPALREYLKLKHRLHLPHFDPGLEPSAGNIVPWIRDEVRKLASTKPSWAVAEGVVFGLFDCGAIAADCRASNWGLPLHERPLLKEVFLSTNTKIPNPPDRKFISSSLVLEADGSQLEALQSVSHGTSIVLHGPPGTGKSQTIVNLIAQAFSENKSVLFVAQKPEAAHVVQRRLAERGLAPFCTMLVPTGDSRNTKAAMLEGLKRRSMVRTPKEIVLQPEIARLEQRIELMNRHAEALRLVMPQFEMTARDILAELALLSLKHVPSVEQSDISSPSTFSSFCDAEQALSLLAKSRSQIPDDAFGVLGGLRPMQGTLAHEAAFALLADCRSMTRLAQEFLKKGLELEHDGCPRLPQVLERLGELAKSTPSSTQLLVPQALDRVFRIRHPRAPDALKRTVAAKAQFAETQARIPNCRELSRSPKLATAKALDSGGGLLERYRVGEMPITKLPRFAAAVDALQLTLAQGDTAFGNGPIRRSLARSDDVRHWQRIVALLEALAKPDAARSFLVQKIELGTPTLGPIHEIKTASDAVSELRTRATPLCIPERLPSLIELRIAQSAIASRASVGRRLLGCLTDQQYRSAKKVARHLLLPTVTRNEWSAALSICLDLHAAEQRWRESLAAAGARADSPATATAWSDAFDWLGRVTELGRTAQLSPHEVWALTCEIERLQTGNSELELLDAATRLCRSDALMGGLHGALSNTTVSFQTICYALRTLVTACRATEKLSHDLDFDEGSTAAAATHNGLLLAQLRDTIESLETDPDAKALFGDDFRGVDTDTVPFERDASWLRECFGVRHQSWHGILDWVFSEHAPLVRRARTVHEFTELLANQCCPLLDTVRRYQANHSFDGSAAALSVDTGNALDTIARAADAILRYEAEAHEVFNLGIQTFHCAERAGAGIIHRFNSAQLSADQLVPCYRRTVFEAALHHDSRLDPLLNFDRVSIDDAIDSLPSLDQSLRNGNVKLLVRKLLDRQPPQGISSGRVREYTEFGYIRHLLGLTRPRFEVQDLLSRAGDAIRAMQPCIIATPSAVSEFLPRDGQMFDLLIMDEASQILPSSAFGSIARARQVVIVGDPQQLPPTTFFMGGRGDDEPEDEDLEGVTDAKSILDRAISSLQNIHLCGHYRSRHHSLIAFSNKHFYEKRLMVVPSVVPRSSKFGIVAHYLLDARYAASKNEIEAKTVATHAMEHLCSRSDETLGIVAFNKQQAELIETHLEALAHASREKFDAYSRAKLHKDPLFIRNLESVQGDERDVIFISYTYGRDATSDVVAQRFGPMVQAGGHRRLNVLVTRAKSRIEVFHSLLPTEIKAESEGAKVMRAYLEYARQTPDFDFATGEYESDFEAEVAKAITLVSSDLVVRPQVSCDNFRIDLGLSLRSNPDRFILGIECDGATYHSSANARDRDLIRQTILEHHGWRIHRVWSTAWWKNSAAELKRLNTAVRDAIDRESARAS